MTVELDSPAGSGRPRLIFRCDGGPRIGLGHLTRCSALASHLLDSFHIVFCCAHTPTSFVRTLGQQGVEFQSIDSEETFVDAIRPEDTIVLDGYDFGESMEHAIKQQGACLVRIDDLRDCPTPADAVLNHSPVVRPEQYQGLVGPRTRLWLGPRYALLRPQFIDQALRPPSDAFDLDYLVCVGGSDPRNLTVPILQRLLETRPDTRIAVITGAAYPFEEDLRPLLGLNPPRLRHESDLSERQMTDLFDRTRTAVVPASTLLLEALCCGSDAITFTYADNQRELYRHATEHRLAIGAGDFKDDFQVQAFESALDRSACSRRSPIVEAFRAEVAQARETIRRAFRELAASRSSG